MPLTVLRALHLAALLALFGTLLFATLVVPRWRPRRHAVIAAGVALIAGAGWFGLQAGAFAADDDWVSALLGTATQTGFGHVILLRLGLIALVPPLLALPRFGPTSALIAAGLALAPQGVVAHAGAAEGAQAPLLIGVEALHVLAAGAWLGGLLPLFLCLATLPPPEARRACERFSVIGQAAVLTIAVTAVIQAGVLIGGLPGLLGTSYGRAALAKIGLFGLLLGLAAANRWWLTPRLDAADATTTRRRLRRSVAVEAACGLLIVMAAGLMASLPPAAHVPPVWPFPWRPSGIVLEEADTRWEVALALVALGVGVGIAAVSWFLPRFRVLIRLAAVLLIGWQAPSLALLLVPAYPTSFQASPTGFAASAILLGQTAFAAHCTGCHGVLGQGDGPASTGRIKPADLTAAHLWDHTDGELFWWIGHGMTDPAGGLAMPGFAAALTEDERWALIDFIRTLNAGTERRLTGDWTRPLPAPDLPILCADTAAESLRGLRGQYVLIVAGRDIVPTTEALATLRLDRATQGVPAGGCASASAAGWPAFATIAGVAPAELDGMAFLVDAQGWLRAALVPGQAPDWRDPAVLKTLLRTLRARPIAAPMGEIHVHGR